MLQFGFGQGVDDDCLTTYRQMSKCRLYLGRVMPSLFIRRMKSRALHPESRGGTCGSAGDPLHLLGESEVRIQNSRRNISR